jgi:hypothetical protein
MRELILDRSEMITLENVLRKYVEILNDERIQRGFTVPEILEIRRMYKRVLQQNQKPEREKNNG